MHSNEQQHYIFGKGQPSSSIRLALVIRLALPTQQSTEKATMPFPTIASNNTFLPHYYYIIIIIIVYVRIRDIGWYSLSIMPFKIKGSSSCMNKMCYHASS